MSNKGAGILGGAGLGGARLGTQGHSSLNRGKNRHQLGSGSWVTLNYLHLIFYGSHNDISCILQHPLEMKERFVLVALRHRFSMPALLGPCHEYRKQMRGHQSKLGS